MATKEVQEIIDGVTASNKQLVEGLVGGIVAANNEMIVKLIEEIRKPTPEEQKQIDAERAETEARQKERKANSAEVKRMIEVKRATQRGCSHEHPNGDTHCVYIQEPTGPGYLICQKNCCIIRPGKEPENYRGNHIYDTALFNKIFQRLRENSGDVIQG